MRFPDDVPTLVHGDVMLRAHRLSDAEAVMEQCTDPESVEWTTVPLGYDHAMAVDWLTGRIPQVWATGEEALFAIESTHPDGRRRFSGSLSLRSRGDKLAEIAYGAHPDVRGRGVMTTAVRLLLHHAFADLGLETVIWWAKGGNVASRRVAWKVGFTFGGTVPRWLDQRGDFKDAWVGSLHRTDTQEPKNQWLTAPVIESGRLRLRPQSGHDLDRTVSACNDPRTHQWLPILPSPYTAADARTYHAMVTERMVTGTGVFWTIADPGTDELVGSIGVPRMAHGTAEIGYWMHPAARGGGAMTEAVRLLVPHLFAPTVDGGLGMRRIFIKTAAGNAASQHVARANGFTEYGRERGATVLGDASYDDHVLFDLLAHEM